MPVGFLLLVIVYGLVLRPLLFGQPAMPIEVVFPLASAFALLHLRRLGHRWPDLQGAIIARLARGMSGFFVLFAIGLLIGSWIVCGTIPMLVHWGVQVIGPTWLYPLAFLVPAAFSTLTGTSWGSAGTIGVVILGVAQSLGGDLAVTAGAVIGGAYFGDKLSPLSDTTNMAALGADVDLFDHVRSMLYTTVPSALVALAVYVAVGIVSPPSGGEVALEPFLAALEELFTFHPILLLPPAIVLFGCVRRLPTIPVLGAGVLCAVVLALGLQRFDSASVFTSLTTGFTIEMAPWAGSVPDEVATLVTRGGLYSMKEAIFAAFLVFFFIGMLDRIDAMAIVVSRVLRFARGQIAAVLSALAAAAVTNALTCNQYATSFIVGDALRARFDGDGVPRHVLSRSIEDTGTMIEPLLPWHPTALFMVATLGVPVADYWRWELLTLANLVIAPLLAITGIGCAYRQTTAHADPIAGDRG
ncbi:MAG TPA: sodium:proton antiporter [bacterium]|nr:sodium:proton antiporter [bacterium]